MPHGLPRAVPVMSRVASLRERARSSLSTPYLAAPSPVAGRDVPRANNPAIVVDAAPVSCWREGLMAPSLAWMPMRLFTAGQFAAGGVNPEKCNQDSGTLWFLP